MVVPFGASKTLYSWIGSSWTANSQRKNGAVLFTDYKLDTQKKLEFYNALVTETSIPECDASGREPTYLSIKVAPEYTKPGKAEGKVSGAKAAIWMPSNFRLTINGTDCTRVSKVEGFTVKQKVISDGPGTTREPVKVPGKVEFPNLVFYVSESFAKSFYDWHEDFVVKGNNNETKERSGNLEFLDAGQQKALLTIKFYNLGIISVTPESDSNSEKARRARVELYCERMELIPGG
jgi:hypothetical protein